MTIRNERIINRLKKRTQSSSLDSSKNVVKKSDVENEIQLNRLAELKAKLCPYDNKYHILKNWILYSAGMSACLFFINFILEQMSVSYMTTSYYIILFSLLCMLKAFYPALLVDTVLKSNLSIADKIEKLDNYKLLSSQQSMIVIAISLLFLGLLVLSSMSAFTADFYDYALGNNILIYICLIITLSSIKKEFSFHILFFVLMTILFCLQSFYYDLGFIEDDTTTNDTITDEPKADRGFPSLKPYEPAVIKPVKAPVTDKTAE
jgi:hypothetical protein